MMEEWKEYKFTDLCDLIGGGTPKTSESSYWDGDIPWLSVKDFGNDDKYVYATEKSITQEGLNNSSTKLLYKDDIIISARGTIGAMAMIKTPMAFNQSCFGIRGNSLVDKHFLYYLTKTKIKELQKNSHGSVFETITRDTFANINCNIPALTEQSEIASILKSLDDKIEVNRKINENLEQQAQALFKSWFVDFEPFRDQPFVESELGMIPQGWRAERLGDILEISKKSVNPSKYPDSLFSHYSIPAYDNEMRPESQYGKEILSNKFVVENNTTLFSKLNPRIKRVWFVNDVEENSICSTEFVPYKAKNSALAAYVHSIISSRPFYDYVLSMVNGATGSHQRFHPEETLSYQIPFDERATLKFNELIEPMLSKALQNRKESRRLAELRDALLPKLMFGEIKVEDVTL